MKKWMLTILLAAGAFSALSAQESPESFKSRYETLTKHVGIDGVGVESLLERWEKAYPEDPDMLTARFNLYLSKALSTAVVAKRQDRFLGARPVLVLKDSLGADVNYFEETLLRFTFCPCLVLHRQGCQALPGQARPTFRIHYIPDGL